MNISDKNFIRLATEGYPLELKHAKEEFFELFATFVNESNENNFFGEVTKTGVAMHAGMRTQICVMKHNDDKVAIYSDIQDNEYSLSSEFTVDEEYRLLGLASLGILYFCDLYAVGTGQTVHFSSDEESEQKIENPPENNNIKYNAWPV
jgi:hypothetical protein|tara:strand:- start:102 stop:548 length:447 start_codon:yes stop_codon:yes gene_type:complete